MQDRDACRCVDCVMQVSHRVPHWAITFPFVLHGGISVQYKGFCRPFWDMFILRHSRMAMYFSSIVESTGNTLSKSALYTLCCIGHHHPRTAHSMWPKTTLLTVSYCITCFNAPTPAFMAYFGMMSAMAPNIRSNEEQHSSESLHWIFIFSISLCKDGTITDSNVVEMFDLKN